MKEYTIGSHDWVVKIKYAVGVYSRDGISSFAEKYHRTLAALNNGDVVSAKILDVDGDAAPAWVKKIGDAIVLSLHPWSFDDDGNFVVGDDDLRAIAEICHVAGC